MQEKKSDKIQHPSLINTNRRELPQPDKGHLPHTLPLTSFRRENRVPLCSTLHWDPQPAVQRSNQNQRHPDCKGRSKTVFNDASHEKSKDVTRIRECSQVARYKINIQKSNLFQYTRSEQSESEHFLNCIYNSIKNIKCLCLNLMEDTQDLHTNNHKILLRN